MSFHFRLRERAFDRRVAVAIPRLTMQAGPPGRGSRGSRMGGGYTSNATPEIEHITRTHRGPPTRLDMRLIVLAIRVRAARSRGALAAGDARPAIFDRWGSRNRTDDLFITSVAGAHFGLAQPRLSREPRNPGDQSDQRKDHTGLTHVCAGQGASARTRTRNRPITRRCKPPHPTPTSDHGQRRRPTRFPKPTGDTISRYEWCHASPPPVATRCQLSGAADTAADRVRVTRPQRSSPGP